MAVSWKVVTAQHVAKACELVAARSAGERSRGLFVLQGGKRLPAKEVARVAYLLATEQPLDTRLRFASGQTMLEFLRKHGCEVERIGTERPRSAEGGSG